MTRSSVREYVEALRGRYRRASRKEKGRMLDEFTQVTGYHRKAAVRLLGGILGLPGDDPILEHLEAEGVGAPLLILSF